jgi:uncharacterized protein (TIGR00730 family)
VKVTIFGGSKPKPGEPAYREAVRLGALLAQAGHTVITGGYMGTMEAVSRGAAEANGHVIGITCQEIENWRSGGANPWVREERKAVTLQERMLLLMDLADAVLALPGGIGTLAELTLFWERMAIESSPRKPFVLIGSGWRNTISALSTSLPEYYPPSHLQMLRYASDVDSVLDCLA